MSGSAPSRDIGVGTAGFPAVAYAGAHDEWNFAWALYAGLGFEVTDALTLELAYRYLDMGDGKTGDLVAYDGDQHHQQPDGVQGHHLARPAARLPLRLLVIV